MDKQNNNNNTQSPRKLYNPIANAPAVYIPCWLIQVPDAKLSLGAKMLYGRIAQWSNASGKVHRTIRQLCAELGMKRAPLCKYLKELKDVALIGTYQKEMGGINHYEFYDHPWMHEPIIDELTYKDSNDTPDDPVPDQGLPRPRLETPPVSDRGHLKYKLNINKKHKENKQKKEQPSALSSGKNGLGLDELLEDNQYDLPSQMLEDWITVRKTKRDPITRTAWNRLNRNLFKIKEQLGIDPIEAFETMVANGWKGAEVKYFETKTSKPEENQWSVEKVWNA